MISIIVINIIIKTQIQLQREELLLDSSQLAKRARMGSLLHQSKDHPQGSDKLSGTDKELVEHDDGAPKS